MLFLIIRYSIQFIDFQQFWVIAGEGRMISNINNSILNNVNNTNFQAGKSSVKSSDINAPNQKQDELIISEDASKTIKINDSLNKTETNSVAGKTYASSNKKIGYFNYYKIPNRYSPTEVVDSYKEMEERYNGDKLFANNENPYSEENLAIRRLDESLCDWAASVRRSCKDENEVKRYLSKKYFGSEDFPYTKKWEEPEKYAMFENDYNAICFGTVKGANRQDPRISGKISKLNSADEYENQKNSTLQQIISNQFKNLLRNNNISLSDETIIFFDINPYTYLANVTDNKNNAYGTLINTLINSNDNSRELMFWGIGNSDSNKDSIIKWQAFHQIKDYTGLDLSKLQNKNGSFKTEDGQDLFDLLKDGIKKSKLRPEYKGVAFDYISGLVNVVASKGWDNIPDLKLDIRYSNKDGFTLK